MVSWLCDSVPTPVLRDEKYCLCLIFVTCILFSASLLATQELNDNIPGSLLLNV
jgi:hypothetical protein